MLSFTILYVLQYILISNIKGSYKSNLITFTGLFCTLIFDLDKQNPKEISGSSITLIVRYRNKNWNIENCFFFFLAKFDILWEGCKLFVAFSEYMKFSELIEKLSDLPRSETFVYLTKITAATQSIYNIPNTGHYNPQFVFFQPTFWRSRSIFKELFL